MRCSVCGGSTTVRATKPSRQTPPEDVQPYGEPHAVRYITKVVTEEGQQLDAELIIPGPRDTTTKPGVVARVDRVIPDEAKPLLRMPGVGAMRLLLDALYGGAKG